MENEDEQRVENRVDDRADQVAQHGKFRAAIRADQVGAADCDDQKREADGGNSGVSTGVINDIRRRTKEKHHRTQKKLNGNAEDHTEDCQHGDGISNIGFRVLRILSAHAEIEVCSTADAAEQTDGCADHAEWERYVGRCVSEHADAVTDKELVYHVIEGADEHRDDARNRKTPQKSADRFRAERIFGRFHRGYLLSNEVKVHRLYRVKIPGKNPGLYSIP